MDTTTFEDRGPDFPRRHHAGGADCTWMTGLSRIGWAWEFLRRNPKYQKQFARGAGTPNDWALQYFEDPTLDARKATIFWCPQACPAVLPVTALPLKSGQGLHVSKLKCETRVVARPGEHAADVLFHQDCRFLQIEVTGSDSVAGVQLLASVVPMPKHTAGRVVAIRRFANLVTSCGLQPNLYPAERRAPRLMKVIQALDGWSADWSYKEIAMVLYDGRRVDAEWNDPGHHLRDQVRRAVYYGRSLMTSGYRQFLR